MLVLIAQESRFDQVIAYRGVDRKDPQQEEFGVLEHKLAERTTEKVHPEKSNARADKHMFGFPRNTLLHDDNFAQINLQHFESAKSRLETLN